jgi:hypothetical protein
MLQIGCNHGMVKEYKNGESSNCKSHTIEFTGLFQSEPRVNPQNPIIQNDTS